MENYFYLITGREDFEENIKNDYDGYHQVHIFSPSEIHSTYFEIDYHDLDDVRALVEDVLVQIKFNSDKDLKISMFEYDGIFIIANDPNLIKTEECFEYNTKRTMYEYSSAFLNVYYFLGEQKIDDYLTKAFNTIGAGRILEYFKPQISALVKEQNIEFERWERLREEDKKAQNFKVEIYKIKKDYIPEKIKEYLCASMESVVCLPEITGHTAENRVVSVVTEIATGKNVDGTLEEAIESIKFSKWLRKHPATIDMVDSMRMDLDEDDPNFLSWEDYVANDDEYEKGDDEYEPKY